MTEEAKTPGETSGSESLAADGSALSRLGKEQIEKTTGKKWDKHHPFFARCLKTLRMVKNEL